MIISAPNKTVLVENVRVTDDTLIVDCDDGLNQPDEDIGLHLQMNRHA